MFSINPNPSEEDTKTKIVLPAIQAAGWKHENYLTEYNLFSDQYRIVPQTDRVERISQTHRRPDIILCTNGFQPLAVIEIKRFDLPDSQGIDQAIAYARTLNVPFAYATSGHKFVEFNLKTGLQREISLENFPSPQELWISYCSAAGIVEPNDQNTLAKAKYYYDVGTTTGKKIPRYYQMVAINSVVQAIIGLHRRRLLLVMATGTGKTFTALQIVYRLKQAGVIKRVLYLADRNKLVDQAKSEGFDDIAHCHKITQGKIDTHHEIYFGLYQQLSTSNKNAPDYSEDREESSVSTIDLYKRLRPDFFDLIIVDECHRGSASEESAWREILEYFHPAIQLGLTATPNTSDGANNAAYFVIRIDLDKDKTGWLPEPDQVDDHGKVIPQKLYTLKDFDRTIILPDRIKRVAQIINDFQHNSLGKMAKTIVFCATQDHALRMRDALRELNPQQMQENSNYIVRMTSSDEEGKALYAQFCSVSEKYPVIVTTSKLLTTGADTKGTKLIVLDANIKSHTEFKQIIGRGTRLDADSGKTNFTILDFRRVSEIFNDPDFDGDPGELLELGDPDPNDPHLRPKPTKTDHDEQDATTVTEDSADTSNSGNNGTDGADRSDPPLHKTRNEYVVSGVSFEVVDATVSYLDDNGKLIHMQLRDFAKQSILKEFPNYQDFEESWMKALSKAQLIRDLENNGVFFQDLRKDLGQTDLDEYDIVNHIAFNSRLLTRQERAERARHSQLLQQYDAQQQQILLALLSIYEHEGISEIERPSILKTPRFQAYGGLPQIVRSIGGKDGKAGYSRAITNLLYQSA